MREDLAARQWLNLSNRQANKLGTQCTFQLIYSQDYNEDCGQNLLLLALSLAYP